MDTCMRLLISGAGCNIGKGETISKCSIPFFLAVLGCSAFLPADERSCKDAGLERTAFPRPFCLPFHRDALIDRAAGEDQQKRCMQRSFSSDSGFSLTYSLLSPQSSPVTRSIDTLCSCILSRSTIFHSTLYTSIPSLWWKRPVWGSMWRCTASR